MQIKTKLTLQFTFIVALIVLLCFIAIFIALSKVRKNEFYQRLEKQSVTEAELMFDIDKIDSTTLRLIDRSQRDLLTSLSIGMYDKKGVELYTNNDQLDIPITQEMLKDIFDGKQVRFNYGDLEFMGILYHGKTQVAALVSGAVDTSTAYKNRYSFKLLFSVYFVIIIVIFIVGRRFAKDSLRPISRIIGEMNNLNVASLESRLKIVNEQDEIGQLALTFNRLLDRIEDVVKSQKLFLSAASHEMKNPMTSITSQLQVTQLKPRSVEEYQETIASVLEDLKQVNKTTNDLIDFARLSYEIDLNVSIHPVRIDDVVWHCKEYFKKVLPNAQMEIQFLNPTDNESDLIVQADESLLTVAFLNVIDNGFKFSNHKKVVVQLSILKKNIQLAFIDQGIGISGSDKENLFDPFWRGKTITKIGGHGLGLAIVKKIADIHQTELIIESKQGEGTSFIFRFPRSF